MTDKEIIERAKEAEKRTCFGELVNSPISKGVNSAFGIGYIEGMVEYRNSMQKEPVSENLMSVAEEYAKKHSVLLGFDCDSEPIETGVDIKKAVIYGANWQKQQLLAKAVDGVVTFDYYDSGNKTYGCVAHDSFCLEDFGLKDRDKVKVIVIKED